MTHAELIDSRRTEGGAAAALGSAVGTGIAPSEEFIATLAHELRTPLTAILNAAQLLQHCGSVEPFAHQAGAIVERQAQHMARVLDDLLDLARGAHNKLVLHKESVDLAMVVTSAVEAVNPLIVAHDHHLTVSLPPEPLSLLTDPSRLRQILINLLTNAARYTESCGCIWLTVEASAEAVVLGVRDTGIGIAPEMLPHLFELFVQSERAVSASPGLDWALGWRWFANWWRHSAAR